MVLMPHKLYCPETCSQSNQKYPLLIFLHGSAERSYTLNVPLLETNGIKQMLAKKLPMYILAPQCPNNMSWQSQFIHFKELLEHIVSEYPIDQTRLYLTGISWGGAGAWYYAHKLPNLFAALVPICGSDLYDEGFPDNVASILHMPIWAIHCIDDTAVPCRVTDEIINTIERLGKGVDKTIYSRLKGVGHVGSWEKAYNSQALFDWLLSQNNQQSQW